jgi:hypothetical protein
MITISPIPIYTRGFLEGFFAVKVGPVNHRFVEFGGDGHRAGRGET